MKPVKQRNNFECGPVAIYNAMVLKRRKPPSVHDLRIWCSTTRYGTSSHDLLTALYLLCSTPVFKCSLDSVPDNVQHKGNVLILGYMAGKEGHYTTIAHDGKNYIAHNWAPDKLIETGSHKDCKPTAKITKRWLVSKLKQPNVEVYLL